MLQNNELSYAQQNVTQNPHDTAARLKLATSLFALGDLPAALRHFDKIVTLERDFSNATDASEHMPSGERRAIANYFAGMCCLQLRRFSQGAAHMEEASQFLELPEGQSTGLDRAEALALAAYLRYLAVVYAERDVHAPLTSSFDESEQRAGLEKARTLIDGALALRKDDHQADRESAIRSHTIAACIYFRLGIAAVGADACEVDVDTKNLTFALDHVNAALDGVSWISASEALVHAGAPVADGGVSDPAVPLQEAALVHAHSTHFGPNFASASDVFVAEGDSSSDSDGEAGNNNAPEPAALPEVSPPLPIVAKYSVPELLTVKGQILLAFGLDERTAEGIRLLDVALAMDASVPQSRLLDDKDAVGTDKRLGLLKAWPIRRSRSRMNRIRESTNSLRCGSTSPRGATAASASSRRRRATDAVDASTRCTASAEPTRKHCHVIVRTRRTRRRMPKSSLRTCTTWSNAACTPPTTARCATSSSCSRRSRTSAACATSTCTWTALQRSRTRSSSRKSRGESGNKPVLE
jgi:tetratricopeptide (TPR) repeat protein